MKLSEAQKLWIPVLAGVALLILAGECRDWLSKKPDVTYHPKTGRLTAEATAWPRSTQTVELQLPDLPAAEVARIGKKYDRADLAGGPRTGDLGKGPGPSSGATSPDSGPASPVAGGVAGGGGAYVEGSIPRALRKRVRTLGEWSFTSPDEECSLDMAAFIEEDGSVTTKALWTNTPADNPAPFLGVPLRWRLTVGGTAWPRTAAFAALGFRVLRVNRIELSPAAMAGYDFTPGAEGAWGGVGAVGTFDF